MYDDPGAIAGTAGGAAGVFALTGFSALFLAQVAIVLVIVGLVLLRAAALKRDETPVPKA